MHSEQDPYNNDDDNETIGMEKYISFAVIPKVGYMKVFLIALTMNLMSMEQWQNSKLKHFDGSEITATNLDFENRLFPILKTIYTVYWTNIKRQQNEQFK
jgi:hypothetical protein